MNRKSMRRVMSITSTTRIMSTTRTARITGLIKKTRQLQHRMHLGPKAHRVHRTGFLQAGCLPALSRVYVTLLVILLATGQLPAQRFSEWFRQKKTQKKYLLAQIAALKGYHHWIEKGYRIASGGLDLVSAFKQGDVSQHRRYFSGQEFVSPAVKKDPKVSAILEMEAAITAISHHLTALSTRSQAAVLNSHERQSVKRMGAAAITEADKDLGTLQLLVTDRQLKMTDGERIKAIDRLYRRVRKSLSATTIFNRRLQALVRWRKRQAAASGEKNLLRRLYGAESKVSK